MDSLPKSRYGRFVHPGLLPDESLDIAAPAKIYDQSRLLQTQLRDDNQGGAQAAFKTP